MTHASMIDGRDPADCVLGGLEGQDRRGLMRWAGAGMLAVLLMSLLAVTGCASGAPGTDGQSVEPLTASDEPDARKRARIRLELASGYFEKGQTTVALDEIKQSLNADPQYGPAYVLRGLVYMRLNDNRLAEESFQRALRINARDGDALHNYGWFACQVERYTEAIGLFDRALALPNYGPTARTYLAKGICLMRMAKFQEAEDSFKHSYELDAGNPITGYNLAALLYKRGEYERAQFYIRRLNNSDLANAESLWLGIKIERRMGNADGVSQLARQLGQRFGASPEWAAYQRGAFNE